MSNKHKDEHFPGDRAQLVSCIESILELNQHGMIEGGIHRMVRQLLRGAVLHLTAPVPIKREDLSTRELLFRALQRLRGKTADGDEAKLIMELVVSVRQPAKESVIIGEDCGMCANEGGCKPHCAKMGEPIAQGQPTQGPWGQGYLFGYNQGFAMATARVENQAARPEIKISAGDALRAMAKILRDDAEREQRTQRAAGCLPVLPVELTEALATNDTLRRELNAARKELAELHERNNNQAGSIKQLRKENESLRARMRA